MKTCKTCERELSAWDTFSGAAQQGYCRDCFKEMAAHEDSGKGLVTMTHTITRKTIDAFWSKVTKGTRMMCLANTYNTKAPGATGVIEKPGKSSMMLRRESGDSFWLSPPRNVSDVVALTDDTITYRIGRDEHTATWQIVA